MALHGQPRIVYQRWELTVEEMRAAIVAKLEAENVSWRSVARHYDVFRPMGDMGLDEHIRDMYLKYVKEGC
jgi:hypothetical protein